MKKILIKIFIISLLINVFTVNINFASNVNSGDITKIENSIFGFDYAKENNTKRVERLEKTIYGKTFQGELNSRISRLSADIVAEKIGQEITPSEDTFAEQEEILSADKTVNYPIVDEIEMKLFNETYKDRDFHTRIVTIERKLFGKIYDVEDYSTRMDRIKTAVIPESLATDNDRFAYDDYENALSSNDLSGLSRNRFGIMPYGQHNYTRPYANYGDNFNDFNNYNDNYLSSDEELADMEYQTFGTEFSNDDKETRLKRLNSAKKAKKSANKYDNYKFQRRMSTAMEIGAMLLMILAMVL